MPMLKHKQKLILNLHQKLSPHQRLNRRQNLVLSPVLSPMLSLAVNPARNQKENLRKSTKLQQLCKEEQQHLLAKLPAVAVAGVEGVAEVVAEEVVPLLSPLQLLLLLGQFRAVLGLLSGQLTRTHFPGTLVLKQGREQK